MFFAAAALARVRDVRAPLTGRTALGRLDSFQSKDYILALAIANGEAEQLVIDGEKVIKTLEEYANAGIDELYDTATQNSQHVINVGDLILGLLGKGEVEKSDG